MLDAKYVTVENWEVNVHGRVHIIPNMELRVYPNGQHAISLDEYNKVLWYIHEQDKKNNKFRKGFSEVS